MLFTQIEFLVLFGATLIFLLTVRNHRAQKIYLLCASNYFYGYWDWRFLGLLWTSTLVDFTVARWLERLESRRARELLIFASVGVNLGILGVFKYYNFFAGSLAAVLEPLGLHVGTLALILPVGISFYTFQTLSYTLDVYRRELPASRSPLDFALFVSFFPQLVAGPIVRASDFLKQLEAPPKLTWERAFSGSRQVVIGLVKKVLIADRLAPVVDYHFEHAGAFSSGSVWLAVCCYAIQIYCDFSGYSDMAIGLARILGYDFKPNFDVPYVSTSITEFWRRWHISLSTWLRDYLYIPLGGNRRGPRRTYLNLMITMLLGGLWHGAAWTFVVWGGIHGAALALERALGVGREPATRALAVLGWLRTLLVVNVAWVFFRAQSFDQAWTLLSRMFVPGPGIAWYPPFAVGAVAFVAAAHLLWALKLVPPEILPARAWYTPALLTILVWLVIAFKPSGFQPFVYFQF
ncbi:MAG: MBOAT family protein [Deltaproteobacteria bacterium]|nr:MBOAT family protein [Deltaproteobacteria bacterium]